MSKKKPKVADNTIALNKRARFDYHIDETFEAGLALTGWEVKSLREGKVQITDTYVLMKDGEAFLIPMERVEIAVHSIHYLDTIRAVAGNPQGVFARSMHDPRANDFQQTRTSVILDYGDQLRGLMSINHNQLTGGVHDEHRLFNKLVMFTLQDNNFTEWLDSGTCRLSVFAGGENVEMKADCDICSCRGNFMCSNCWN